MGVQVNLSQLKERCKVLALMAWGAEFNLPVETSGRMTSAYGYYTYKKSDKPQPIRLRFAARLVDGRFNQKTIDEVILHELTHWYRHINYLDHGDFDYGFKKEIERIGSHVTHTLRDAGWLYVSKCTHCGKLHTSISEKKAKSWATSKYNCKCKDGFKGKMEYIGYMFVEDTNPTFEAKDPIIRELYSKLPPINVGGGKTIPKVTTPKVTVKVADTGTPYSKAISTTIRIEDIIEQAKRISNKQMIPAMKTAVDENSKEKLELLKTHYPAIFESTIKYIGQGRQEKLKKLMEG